MSLASDARPRDALAARSPRGGKGARAAVLLGGGIVALVVLTLVLYRAGSHAGPVDADSATVILEGSSMLHGHLGLGGWALSRDSFWTIDAVATMLGVLVEGVRPVLLYAVPAVLAALVVLVGAWLARGQATRAGRVVAVVALLALLALPSRALSLFYLQGPYHVGTALYALLAFAGLRSRRFGWGWLAAVVLLGLGMLGDLQLAVFGVAPALGAGLVAMARRRDWRAGIATLSAAGASVLLAVVVREIADLLGTFSVNPANPVASPRQMLANLADLGRYGPALLGVGQGTFVPTKVPAALSELHVVGIAVVLGGGFVALAVAAHGFLAGRTSSLGAGEGDWHLEDLLVLAFFADLAIFARLDQPGNHAYARYLTAAIIFGAILGARLLGRLADAAAGRRLTGVVAGVAGGALLVAYLVGFVASIGGPPATNTATTLASFLESHDLTRGLGDYWSASIVSVESSGRVLVRPVIDSPEGYVARYNRETDAAWYAHHHFQFVVYEPALQLVQLPVAQATFGRPSHAYLVGPYRILVFPRPIAVSTVGAGA